MYIKTERGKPMKKSLALFLTFIMVLGLLPSVAFAAGDGRAIQSSISPSREDRKAASGSAITSRAATGLTALKKNP